MKLELNRIINIMTGVCCDMVLLLQTVELTAVTMNIKSEQNHFKIVHYYYKLITRTNCQLPCDIN